jgi:large subunit ribosomal protein L23
MEPQKVVLGPLVTEKATTQSTRHNQTSFVVAHGANKHQIRASVEALYGVRVEKIRTMVVPGKLKRRGANVGKRPNWKKAIVTLKQGDVIDFFATE